MSDPAINPYAPPTSIDQPPAPDTQFQIQPEGLSQAARIAGGLMIVNGILVAIEFAMTTSKSSGGFHSPLPAIIDILIGVSLVRGIAKYKTWAMVRVVFGAVVWTGINLAQGGDPITVVAMVAGFGALYALLYGHAGKPRMIIGTVVFCLYLLLNAIGLVAMAKGG